MGFEDVNLVAAVVGAAWCLAAAVFAFAQVRGILRRRRERDLDGRE